MRITNLSYVAEYFATFFFILAILLSHGNPWWIGLAIAVAIFFVGPISGGHLNPAVTFTMWMDHQMRTADLLYYVIAQCLGGVSALYAFKMAA